MFAIKAIKESLSVFSCMIHIVEALLDTLNFIHPCTCFEVVFPCFSVKHKVLEQEYAIENHGDNCQQELNNVKSCITASKQRLSSCSCINNHLAE